MDKATYIACHHYLPKELTLRAKCHYRRLEKLQILLIRKRKCQSCQPVMMAKNFITSSLGSAPSIAYTFKMNSLKSRSV